MSRSINMQTHTNRGSDKYQVSEIIKPGYSLRGFLPVSDPLCAFPTDSPYAFLDQVGRDLPSLLLDKGCRRYLKNIEFPPWQGIDDTDSMPALRLYYLRLGFIASAYINQVGYPVSHTLPNNISGSLVRVCKLLKRPPILSYDGYALYNWKRFDPNKPIQLGNIDTLQNFVHLYDEHWFVLIHVEIEALAASILAAIKNICLAFEKSSDVDINLDLWQVAETINRQVDILKRIPEKMDPMLYYKTFRPYIRFFEQVVYQGVEQKTLNFRGETGAQSSIMPMLVALMKIPHQVSILTEHLFDMRQYMPIEHQLLIEQVENLPDLKNSDYKAAYNAILDNMIAFREVHLGWANEYIHQHVKDPRGTGGTPYMRWLNQLISETEAHKL